MSETNVAQIRLRSDPDIPWIIALVTGTAAGWNFKAIPRGRSDLLPSQQERLAVTNTIRVQRLIEGLIHHPRQCWYAIALWDVDGADNDWVKHVVNHHKGQKGRVLIELAKRGFSKSWIQEMFHSVPLEELGLPPHELFFLGLVTQLKAEEIVESMPEGSGKAALAMNQNGISKMSWAIRVILADKDKSNTIELMKRLSVQKNRRRVF